MAKYRKKPVVIEAVRWTADNVDEVLEFIYADDRWKLGVPDDGNVGGPGIGHTISLGTLDIPTLEGVMTANPGDWIIRGVQGEVYPCKPIIFDATYDAVPEPPKATVHFSGGPWAGQTYETERVIGPLFAVGHEIGNHYWLDTKSDPPTYYWDDTPWIQQEEAPAQGGDEVEADGD